MQERDIHYVPTMKKFRIYFTKKSEKTPKEYDLEYDTVTKLYSTVYDYDTDIECASPIYTDNTGLEIHHWIDDKHIRKEHKKCHDCMNPGTCSNTKCKVSFISLFPIYVKPPWYQCVKE